MLAKTDLEFAEGAGRAAATEAGAIFERATISRDYGHAKLHFILPNNLGLHGILVRRIREARKSPNQVDVQQKLANTMAAQLNERINELRSETEAKNQTKET